MKGSEDSATTVINKPEMLRTWANLGVRRLAVQRPPMHNWEPLFRMIEVARERLKGEAKRLRALLQESRERLRPLEDPFDVDLGLHRWLAEEREEAYSDWLQWVIAEVKKPRLVFQIFGIPPPSDISTWERVDPEIEREYLVPFGHAGREGRLDLLIRYGDRALIVIEVKKVGAEEADIGKQEGYNRSLDIQPISKERRYPVLIAVSAQEGSYHDFRSVSWAKVCAELRQVSCMLCQEKRVMTAAMILAFVAAVEQNLLGFSAELVRNVCDGTHAVIFDAAVVHYLANSLKQEE